MKDILKHAGEFLRSLRNGRFERTSDGGILMQDQGIVFRGVGGVRNITRDEPWEDHKNVVTIQGITDLLNNGLTNRSWYFAPYAAAVTPVNTLTAANFNSTQTEFTNYTETTRQLCDYIDAVSASTDNTAAPATITIGAGGQTSIYGFGIMSASAKSSTAGVCLAVPALGTGRTGLQVGDQYGMRHTLTGTSA